MVQFRRGCQACPVLRRHCHDRASDSDGPRLQPSPRPEPDSPSGDRVQRTLSACRALHLPAPGVTRAPATKQKREATPSEPSTAAVSSVDWAGSPPLCTGFLRAVCFRRILVLSCAATRLQLAQPDLRRALARTKDNFLEDDFGQTTHDPGAPTGSRLATLGHGMALRRQPAFTSVTVRAGSASTRREQSRTFWWQFRRPVCCS
jgi:hypothetical protein